jgi:endonuclease/exonuclease/phosphatase family metal-dependent hydrolase
MRQVEFVSSLIAHLKYVVLMGDLNCGNDSAELRLLTQSGRLKALGDNENTFPSWQPVRKVDHILVSEALEIENARVIDYPMSDHLPVGVDVILPEGLQLAA